MKKIAILITTCLILGGVLGGCGNKVDKSNNKNTVSQINNKDNIVNKENKDAEKEDTVENKEKESTENINVDLSEFELDDDEDNYSSIMSGMTKINDYMKFGFRKFTGVYTITKINKNATISYESELEDGKLNVVILDSECKVLKVLETNKSETIDLNFSDTGEYIIKAVGDEAYKGKVEITIKENISKA